MRGRKIIAGLLSVMLVLAAVFAGNATSAKAATDDIIINISATNCSIYYKTASDWARVSTEQLKFDSANVNRMEIKVMPNDGYSINPSTACTFKGPSDSEPVTKDLSAGGTAGYESNPDTTQWGGGVELLLSSAGEYTLTATATQSSQPVDPAPPQAQVTVKSISIYYYNANSVLWSFEDQNISSATNYENALELTLDPGKSISGGELLVLPCRDSSGNYINLDTENNQAHDLTTREDLVPFLGDANRSKTLEPANAGEATTNIKTIQVTDPVDHYVINAIVRIKTDNFNGGKVTASAVADAYGFGWDGVIDLTTANTLQDAYNHELEVYYGATSVSLDDLNSSCTIDAVETVDIPSGAVTVNGNSSTGYTITWNSNFYDKIPLKLTVTNSASQQHTSYVVITTGGIELHAIASQAADPYDPSQQITVTKVNHGSQPGPDISSALNWDTEHNRAVVATFYYPSSGSYSDYKMLATYKWADGSVTTAVIGGVAETTCVGGSSKGGDYVVWRGTTANAPVSVSVNAIPANAFNTQGEFGGVKYGSSDGCTITANEYRW